MGLLFKVPFKVLWVLILIMSTTAKSLPSVHGHRGSRGTHPENTLPAFDEAVKAGVQVLELDLQLSKDDVPIISHEAEISAEHCVYKNGKKLSSPIPVRTLTIAQLKEFDCGSVKNPRFPEQKLIPGTSLPTLEEFLVWAKKNAPTLEYNIETKMTAADIKNVADPKLFATRVIEVLRKNHAIEKTILQSFDFRTLEVAKKIEPKLRLSCLFEEEKNFCEPTRKVGAQIASPHFELLTPEEIKRCHDNGIQVVPWTANEENEWKKLLALKVDAIITDYPRKLLSFLKNQ